jgi:hypothetical protein
MRTADMKMDATSLFREESIPIALPAPFAFLIPVTRDGGPDQTRATIYTGEAQILTNVGPLPISFDIPAATLGEAVQKYGDAAKEGVERDAGTAGNARQASSSILVPASPGLAAVCLRRRARSSCPDPAHRTLAKRRGRRRRRLRHRLRHRPRERSRRKSANARTLADRCRRLG